MANLPVFPDGPPARPGGVPMTAAYRTVAIPAGVAVPGKDDVEALRLAVSSMANWRHVLKAQGEPTHNYEVDLAAARAALARIERFLENVRG